MSAALSSTQSPGVLDKRDWIAGLERGLSLLETFTESNSRQTAAQAGQHCGLTRTAARRYLLTLQHLVLCGQRWQIVLAHPQGDAAGTVLP